MTAALAGLLAGCAGTAAGGWTATSAAPPASTAATSSATSQSPSSTGPGTAGGSGTTAETTTGTAAVRGDLPEVSAVDRHDPVQVAEAFTRLAFTSDTAVDSGPGDAGRRAAALADARLGEALEANTAAPGAAWQEWSAHRAYTLVELSENIDDGRPPDTPAQLLRSWAVTVTPVAEDGWTGPAQVLVVYLALSNSAADGSGTWTVTDLRAAS